MLPIELLQTQLRKYESALQHSIKSYEARDISLHTHKTHIKNLAPKIQEYKQAITTLKNLQK